jgi:transposase
VDWLRSHLLPTLRATYGHRPIVVVLDNVSIHTNHEVVRVIKAEGHIVRFLPPYSPDFNPIELTFRVLKAWIQRNYHLI